MNTGVKKAGLMKKNTTHAIGFRVIKVLDIGYVTTIYFILAFCISVAIDKVMGVFDPGNSRSPSPHPCGPGGNANAV